MKILIAIDPGHGDTPGTPGYDPGVVSRLGRHESEAALASAETVKYVLEARGFDAYLTRDGTAGRKPDIRARVETATRRGAKAFVSVHYNCHKCGSGIYFSPGAASRRLATLAAKQMGIVRLWPSSESNHGGLYIDSFPDARPSIMLEPSGIEKAPAKDAPGKLARLDLANDVTDALELYFYRAIKTRRIEADNT